MKTNFALRQKRAIVKAVTTGEENPPRASCMEYMSVSNDSEIFGPYKTGCSAADGCYDIQMTRTSALDGEYNICLDIIKNGALFFAGVPDTDSAYWRNCSDRIRNENTYPYGSYEFSKCATSFTDIKKIRTTKASELPTAIVHLDVYGNMFVDQVGIAHELRLTNGAYPDIVDFVCVGNILFLHAADGFVYWYNLVSRDGVLHPWSTDEVDWIYEGFGDTMVYVRTSVPTLAYVAEAPDLQYLGATYIVDHPLGLSWVMGSAVSGIYHKAVMLLDDADEWWVKGNNYCWKLGHPFYPGSRDSHKPSEHRVGTLTMLPSYVYYAPTGELQRGKPAKIVMDLTCTTLLFADGTAYQAGKARRHPCHQSDYWGHRGSLGQVSATFNVVQGLWRDIHTERGVAIGVNGSGKIYTWGTFAFSESLHWNFPEWQYPKPDNASQLNGFDFTHCVCGGDAVFAISDKPI